MNIIVVGCGRVGSDLARRLNQKGHQVTIIDHTADAFRNLSPDFVGRMVEGEGISQDVLHRAEIGTADGLAAVTDSDPINAVVAHIARVEYGISNVVVRNQDPSWRVFHEAFGLQVVSSASWGAQRIEELLYPTAMPIVFSAGNGEVEVYEVAIPKTWSGRKLQDILRGGQCVAVALTHAGQAILPSGETLLEESDIVYLSATLEGIEALHHTLTQAEEG